MKKTLLASMLALCCFSTAFAAEIVPVNADPANTGLNDPTPLAPAGGNPGTTIGEQRRIVYQYAADMWGAVLESPAQIRVQASFAALQCIPGRTVLGSARANPIYVLTESGQPNTLYHGALADALIGEDLDAGGPSAGRVDIISQFNSSYGKTNPDGTPCSPGSGWYYGLDGNTPSGLTSFLDTVMHEIAHGLGFSGFGRVDTGAKLGGYEDIFSRFVYDNVSNRRYYDPTMTDAGRVAANVGNNLVFRGPQVTAEVPLVLDDKIALRLSGALVANYDYGTAAFGPLASTANFTGALALANDGTGADTADACEALPAGSLTGKIAFVNRGGPAAPAPACGFELKATNVQNAGAIAVIIGNVATSGSPNATVTMADDPTLTATIPAVNLTLNDANAVRAAISGTINSAIAPVPGVLGGADALGYARLYAPTTLVAGSTFSHYDVSATPNALMEPAINDSLAANAYLDLTPALFKDEGWTLNPGNGAIGGCDTGIDAIEDGGMAIGASIQAYASVCLNNAGGSRANYLRCVTDQATKLKNAGLINTTQLAKVRTCASKVTP